jgi:predicted phosphodiesterase
MSDTDTATATGTGTETETDTDTADFRIRVVRIACVSDTHAKHGELDLPADIDVLLHAGDFTRYGKQGDVESFNAWLGTLAIPHRVVVLGNHENGVFRKCNPAVMLSNATAVLCGTGVQLPAELGELRIYGCRFCWPMSAASACRNPEYTDIPKDANAPHIVMAHGPAKGFCDGDSGCPEFAEAMLALKPLLVVSGHIHKAYGRMEHNGITFVNAASERFEGGVNPPIVVELKVKVKAKAASDEPAAASSSSSAQTEPL